MKLNLLSKKIAVLALFSFYNVSKAQSTGGNPVINNEFLGDPAAMVHKGKVYLYAGHDEAPDDFHFYKMNEWKVYSSSDLKTWEKHPVPLKASDFAWASGDAWASQVIERDGKFYWYVTVSHKTVSGKAIGVAVSDSPLGPFKDALGKALVTNDMTKKTHIDWDDIDPTVYIDDKGQGWLFWGNTACYYAKLKPNMTELDGEIKTIDLPKYTEAPYIHKKNGWYYLSYATGFPEKIAYAMSKSLDGPWEYKGILNELAGNSNTNHQSIIEFKGKDYFIYHNGAIEPNGGSFRRSVSIEYLYYNKDGTIKPIIMTTKGIN
ncbi:glycoside hydrolase family 43 protein [Epilithonimonas sp.]|uniref:glycoside hydrolase family 43 protein n=1 Tax=Epilithonimonas sp. TaxID=2894511 RepID=UPI0028978845|nr:glycoside hydrolase family 43 protein [Epilithonimonas sp.]